MTPASTGQSLDASAGQWLELWKVSPQRSIFSHPEFLAALPLAVRFAMIWDKNGDCAGVPLLFDLEGQPLPPGRLPCVYHGIHLHVRTGESHSRYVRQLRLMERLVEAILSEQPELYLYNSWRLDDLRALQWHNYHTPERGMFRLTFGYTGILRLSDYAGFEQYLSSIRACRRQEYQKSQVSGLTYTDSAHCDELLRVYTDMFALQNKVVDGTEAQCLRSICAAIQTKGIGRIAACRDGKRLVAAVVFLVDDRCAYYLYGMTDPNYRKHNPNSALLLHCIRSFFGGNIAEVDFVGVNSPRRGDFKISFNPTLKPYVIGHFKQTGNGREEHQ